MKKLPIDFDEVQKAMEDISRDAFDYFLDLETGEVIILSEDIIARARELLSENIEEDNTDYDEIEFDEEHEIPDWMEDEIELCLDVLIHDKDRYVRIPERRSGTGFETIREFTATLEPGPLKEILTGLADGKGAFRKFKDAMDPFPRERKQWYTFNAMSMRAEIRTWLESCGVEPERKKESSRP